MTLVYGYHMKKFEDYCSRVSQIGVIICQNNTIPIKHYNNFSFFNKSIHHKCILKREKFIYICNAYILI